MVAAVDVAVRLQRCPPRRSARIRILNSQRNCHNYQKLDQQQHSHRPHFIALCGGVARVRNVATLEARTMALPSLRSIMAEKRFCLSVARLPKHLPRIVPPPLVLRKPPTVPSINHVKPPPPTTTLVLHGMPTVPGKFLRASATATIDKRKCPGIIVFVVYNSRR